MRRSRRSLLSRGSGSKRPAVGVIVAIITALIAASPTAVGGQAASPAGTISTIAGGGYGDNLPARQGLLNMAQMAEDGHGNVYIADKFDNLVRKVRAGRDGVVGGPNDTDDVITTIAGTIAPLPGLTLSGTTPPNGGYSGDGGPATAARLQAPDGIAVDGSGDVYIADSGNNRVRFVCEKSGGCTLPAGAGGGSTLASGVIVTIAGDGASCFSPSCDGDGGPATSASIGPEGMAVDSAGNVYIADLSFALVRFVCMQATTCMTTVGPVPSGDITTVAGGGTCATLGDGGPATAACLQGPWSVTLDAGLKAATASGTFYVSDIFAGQIRAVGKNGVINSLAASCNCLNGPEQMAVAARGRALDVSNAGNNQVIQIDLTTQAVTTLAGNGSFGYGGDGGPAVSAELAVPDGLAVDSAGFLIADGNNVVRRVATDGLITSVAGTGSPTDAGDGGPSTNAGLGNPNDVAVDAAGDMVVADTGDNRVRRIHDGIISTIAGTGFAGDSGDGGPGTAAQLSAPTGVAIDGAGNVYIADNGNNRVRLVCVQSTTCSTAAGTVPSGDIITVAGNGAAGDTGDGGAATAASLVPYSVAVDRSGHLYISDQASSVVRGVGPAGMITTVAGHPGAFSGGDGGPATSAGLSPYGIAVDSAGNLYIADYTDVRFVCLEPVACSNVAGTTSPGNIASIVRQQNQIVAVAVDAAGNVYWSVGASGAGTVSAVCGQTGGCAAYTGPVARASIVGIAGYTSVNNQPLGDGGPASQATLDPKGVAVDSAGNVDIAQLNFPWGGRIRQVVNPLGIGAYASPGLATFGSPPVGQTTAAQTITLTNPSTAALKVTSATIAGSNASDFIITSDGCSGSNVRPGRSCAVKVAFKPAALGERTATLSFADAASTAPQSVTLFGG